MHAHTPAEVSASTHDWAVTQPSADGLESIVVECRVCGETRTFIAQPRGAEPNVDLGGECPGRRRETPGAADEPSGRLIVRSSGVSSEVVTASRLWERQCLWREVGNRLGDQLVVVVAQTIALELELVGFGTHRV
jgi:hypothetical protein